MPKPFFITTAIDYTNGAPHIGHAYEKVLGDVLARYHRLKGEEVFLMTGVDQHGQKVQQSAEKEGVAPQEFVDGLTAKFVALWEKLDVRYDAWAATTDATHKDCVRAILQKLWDDQDPATGASQWIYKKTERGWYSVRQEQFLTDKERGPDGEFGPEWGQVEERDEENFYFRLKEHRGWLRGFIKARSEAGNPFVIPDFRVSELLNAVEKMEGDLCISRPASRLKWGIPFPESFGAGFVTYVWFDALVNYISFAGYDPAEQANPKSEIRNPNFNDLWPALHVIGKDILIPAHGVYWPVMLKALGFADQQMPTLLVHGWWNIAGTKMSKSTGNIVDPDALADKYGAEALRYYLMTDIATGRDADFSEERLVTRYNSDLANSLGNLLNRTLNMVQKYKKGEVRNGLGSDEPYTSEERPLSVLRERAEYCVGVYRICMQDMAVHSALSHVNNLVTRANQFVDDNAPWRLAKLPGEPRQLDDVLYALAESLRIIAILISPVLPKAAHGIFAQLNWDKDEHGNERPFRLVDAVWGGLPDGHVLGQPTPLFPRIEKPAE